LRKERKEREKLIQQGLDPNQPVIESNRAPKDSRPRGTNSSDSESNSDLEYPYSNDNLDDYVLDPVPVEIDDIGVYEGAENLESSL
jgi:hypothetical protein